MEFFKPGRQFDFMGQRKFWITLSLTLVAISTILIFYPGPNYGTDFRGGTEVEVAFTLIVGIVCSLFTGVFCTRLVFDWWVRGAKVKRLSVGAEF